jgi:glycosyltransferase involved in cell wall biosynthesis
MIDREMYESISRGSCRRATKIIAISIQTKADLIKFFGIEADKIEVIYQSCNNLYYDRISEEQKLAIRLKFNLPRRFILCVGTIERRKNQLAILKAVVEGKLDTTVVILGKPTEYMNEINQFICDTGISSQVKFLHNTNADDLQVIYQMAEVMVYPSFFEGFGLPVLEAQASGCPVITSNISSLPEAGGNGAIYINPNDILEISNALNKILSSEQFRNELIKKGTANAELFSEKIVAEKLMKLYRELSGPA